MIRRRWWPALRTVLLGGLVGVLALGVGGRLAMRGVAVAGGIAPGFSWGGSLEVLAIGGIYGLAGGVLYLGVERVAPPRWWRGAVLGALGLMLVVADLNIRRPELATLAAAHWVAALALFGLAFLCYGVLLDVVATRLRGATTTEGARVGS